MAMTYDTAIKFTTKLDGTGLDQLKRQLQALSQQSQVSNRSLDQLYTATRALGSASGNTIASLRQQAAALSALRDQAEFGSRKFKMLTRDIEDVEARLKRFQTTATSSTGISRGQAMLAGFAGGIGAQVASYGAQLGMQAIGGIAQAGLDAETAQVRLKALTRTFGEYNEAQAAATRIAGTLHLSQTEATDAFSKLYAALRPTGVSIKELESIYVGFNAAARASGATADETAAAFLQLKQSLGSGILQGDELRSILEQAPAVGQAVAEQLTKTGQFGKVTRGQLKELGSEGKITADIVIKALQQLGETELPKLGEQFGTGQQAIKDFQNATNELGVEIAKTFGPTAISLVKEFTRFLKAASLTWESLFGASDGDQKLQVAIKAREQAIKDANKRFGLIGLNTGERESYLRQREAQLLTKFEAERVARAAGGDKPTAEQLQARKNADAEAAAGRARANAKALEDEVKIRREAELKLADFRLQSIKRIGDLERTLGDEKLNLERSIAEARRKLTAQEQDIAFQSEIQKRRAAGIDTGGLEAAQRINALFRTYDQEKIANEQNATDRRVQIERKIEDLKLSVAEGVSRILQDAGDKLAEKMQKGAQSAAGILTGQSSGGVIARTGNTGQSTGPHLDIRWADGRPISKADADRYFSVGGRSPSSYGVTSPYGRRSLFGRSFHAGMDFGTPAGTPISLQGGATLGADLGNTGAGGYAALINTPQGAMKILHLTAGSVARPSGGASLPPGAYSGVDRARTELDGLIGTDKGLKNASSFKTVLGGIQDVISGITADLDGQVKSSKEQYSNAQRYGELVRNGLSPEEAQRRINLEAIGEKEMQALAGVKARINSELESGDLTEKQRQDLEAQVAAIDARIAKQPEVLKGLEDEAAKTDRIREIQERNKALADGIADSIGGGMTQAFDALINGTESWGNSLRDIASGVLKDIARQLMQIMVIQPIVKGISGGLLKLFGSADGNIFDRHGVVPFAMGGIVTRPTIFPFANGGAGQLGLMGEAGPEAIIPLKRGADGKLGVAGGGGGTNITVNVDASGTKASGDSGKGNQLARVVAEAVQAELVKQKRPGGILAA